MAKKRSAYDRVHSHLVLRGSCAPITGKRQEDLVTLVRRYNRVRTLGEGYGEVELSPYMLSLMRVSDVPEESLAAAAPVAVAGV
jgi:hypothetical protein